MQGCNVEAPGEGKAERRGARFYSLAPFSFPERREQLSLSKLQNPSERPARAAHYVAYADKRPITKAEAMARGAECGLVRGSYLTAYPGARLIQVHLPGIPEPPKSRGIRGKVEGMSDDSRARLMRLLHTIDKRARMPAFVTLTFAEVPSPAQAKAALDRLFKRWARRSPQLCAVWRMEAHPGRSEREGRPVPHFHLLVWGAWIDREQLSRDWVECCKTGQGWFWQHLAAGTKVETVRSFRGVCSYAAKYLGKQEEVSLGEDCGRVWGIFRREKMPTVQPVGVRLSTRALVRVVRRIRQLLHKRDVRCEWMPTSIYCESPEAFLRLVEECGP